MYKTRICSGDTIEVGVVKLHVLRAKGGWLEVGVEAPPELEIKNSRQRFKPAGRLVAVLRPGDNGTK